MPCWSIGWLVGITIIFPSRLLQIRTEKNKDQNNEEIRMHTKSNFKLLQLRKKKKEFIKSVFLCLECFDKMAHKMFDHFFNPPRNVFDQKRGLQGEFLAQMLHCRLIPESG